MTSIIRLRHRDYDRALEAVSEAAATSGASPFELPTIEALVRLIPADMAGYFEYSDGGEAYGARNTFFVGEPADSITLDWQTDTVAASIASWPLLDRPKFVGRVLKLSDFLTRAQLRRNPWYAEVMRPTGIEHEFKTWLPAPKGTFRGFFLVRVSGTRDFNERDRGVLQLLGRHLALIRERWELRNHPRILTRREAEVLQRVAEGFTNGEIAQQLVVSPTTVRTHLENIYAKLGVHTRTAAVAWLRRVP